MRAFAVLGFTAVLAMAWAVQARDWPPPVSSRPGTVPGSVVGVDAKGRVAQITLSDGRTIVQEHSSDGRITAQRAANGSVIDVTYDARGRVETLTEQRVTARFVYDDANDLAGVVYGADAPRFLKTMSAVGLHPGDQARPVTTRGQDGHMTTAGNSIGQTRFDYVDAATMRQTLTVGAWSFWVQRKTAVGTVFLSDSAGGSYSYLMVGGHVTSIRDSGGRVLCTRTHDAFGRVLHVAVLGVIDIDYSYDKGFDWREKTVSLTTGVVVKRFSRADYDDATFDGSIHAHFRGPTGEPIAAVDGDHVTYNAGVLTPFVTLSADGKVEARSFAFGSSVAYSDDEIRFMADGSVKVLPALPHAEFTMAARTARPLEITIPVQQQAAALSQQQSSSVGSSATAHHRLVPAPLMMISTVTSCEWIPGGCTGTGGDTSTCFDGRMECSSY